MAKYKIGDTVMFKGEQGKITCVLSEQRYQVYTRSGKIKLAHENELTEVK